MEISRYGLLLIVKACRGSIKLAGSIRELMTDMNSLTFSDIIAGQLCDALFMIAGENLAKDQDFNLDSETMKLLNCKHMSDDDVTDAIIRMRTQCESQQPCPHFIDRKEMRKQSEAGCGYMAPDGDRK